MKTEHDADILNVTAKHLYGLLRFERHIQDRRTYYGLTLNGRSTGSLTNATKARETVAYWQCRGWIN